MLSLFAISNELSSLIIKKAVENKKSPTELTDFVSKVYIHLPIDFFLSEGYLIVLFLVFKLFDVKKEKHLETLGFLNQRSPVKYHLNLIVQSADLETNNKEISRDLDPFCFIFLTANNGKALKKSSSKSSLFKPRSSSFRLTDKFLNSKSLANATSTDDKSITSTSTLGSIDLSSKNRRKSGSKKLNDDIGNGNDINNNNSTTKLHEKESQNNNNNIISKQAKIKSHTFIGIPTILFKSSDSPKLSII